MTFRRDRTRRNASKVELNGLSPLEATSLAKQVANRLLRAVEEGQIPVGTRLVETQLAELLGISRGPVREALQLLAEQGLVRRHPHRGSSVASFSPEEIAEVFILRADLEALAARLAVARGAIRDKDVDTLKQGAHAMAAAVRSRQFKQLLDLDLEFHRLLSARSGSRWLMSLLDSLRAHTRIAIGLANRNTDAVSSIVQTHHNVIAALESGDIDRVDRETKAHVLETLDFLGIHTPTSSADRQALQMSFTPAAGRRRRNALPRIRHRKPKQT